MGFGDSAWDKGIDSAWNDQIGGWKSSRTTFQRAPSDIVGAPAVSGATTAPSDLGNIQGNLGGTIGLLATRTSGTPTTPVAVGAPGSSSSSATQAIDTGSRATRTVSNVVGGAGALLGNPGMAAASKPMAQASLLASGFSDIAKGNVVRGVVKGVSAFVPAVAAAYALYEVGMATYDSVKDGWIGDVFDLRTNESLRDWSESNLNFSYVDSRGLSDTQNPQVPYAPSDEGTDPVQQAPKTVQESALDKMGFNMPLPTVQFASNPGILGIGYTGSFGDSARDAVMGTAGQYYV